MPLLKIVVSLSPHAVIDAGTIHFAAYTAANAVIDLNARDAMLARY